jgi:hypothetical protein
MKARAAKQVAGKRHSMAASDGKNPSQVRWRRRKLHRQSHAAQTLVLGERMRQARMRQIDPRDHDYDGAGERRLG